MISPNGVKANMCCASCKHLSYKVYEPDFLGIKRWCKKKNRCIINNSGKCGYYVMAEFFQKEGYKVLE